MKEKSLSVYATINTTNNGSEAYHKTLKYRIKTHRPNIWTFLECLEEILCDFDLEYERLEQGLEISCPGKKLHKEHTIKRNICKEKLAHCTYFPMESLRIVSTTMGKPTYQSADENIIEDEYPDDNSSIQGESEHVQLCVVCLQTRHEPHVLVPCGHGNLCCF